MYRSVLLVCTANVCRSPMAEVVFATALEMRPKAQAPTTTEPRVSSAGITAPVGSLAAPFAVEILRQRGLDLSAHRARQLTPAMLIDFDLCLVMEQAQQNFLARLATSAAHKVFRLGHWGDFDIPDPVGASLAVFEKTLTLIERGVADWAPYLPP